MNIDIHEIAAMLNKKATSLYQTVNVDSRAGLHDQHALVGLMYEAVLECLVMAKGAIQQGDISTKTRKISHAIRILEEGLWANLDTTNGGELANNLADTYQYAIVRLTQANSHNDIAMLDEVAALIRPIADAWKTIREPSSSTASGAPTQTPPTTEKKSLMQSMGSLYSSFAMSPQAA